MPLAGRTPEAGRGSRAAVAPCSPAVGHWAGMTCSVPRRQYTLPVWPPHSTGRWAFLAHRISFPFTVGLSRVRRLWGLEPAQLSPTGAPESTGG